MVSTATAPNTHGPQPTTSPTVSHPSASRSLAQETVQQILIQVQTDCGVRCWIGSINKIGLIRRGVVALGVSCSRYYAMRIAHTHKDRLVGAVAQGGGCHYMFDPEW